MVSPTEGARGVECIRIVERSYRNRCSPWKGGWSSEPRLSVLQFARQRGSLSRGFFFVTGAKDQRSQPFGFVYRCPVVSFQGNKTRSVRRFRFGKILAGINFSFLSFSFHLTRRFHFDRKIWIIFNRILTRYYFRIRGTGNERIIHFWF